MQNIVIANKSFYALIFRVANIVNDFLVIFDRWGFPEALHNIPPQDTGGSKE